MMLIWSLNKSQCRSHDVVDGLRLNDISALNQSVESDSVICHCFLTADYSRCWITWPRFSLKPTQSARWTLRGLSFSEFLFYFNIRFQQNAFLFLPALLVLSDFCVILPVFVTRSWWLLRTVTPSSSSSQTMRSSPRPTFVMCQWGARTERPSSFPSGRWSSERSPSLWKPCRLRDPTSSAWVCSSRCLCVLFCYWSYRQGGLDMRSTKVIDSKSQSCRTVLIRASVDWLQLQNKHKCFRQETQEILILFYCSAFPPNISHSVCLPVVFPHFLAVDSSGRRTRAVVLHLAAVWGFWLAAFQRSDFHLPGRCCGGQRESFSDGRWYVNTLKTQIQNRYKQITTTMKIKWKHLYSYPMAGGHLGGRGPAQWVTFTHSPPCTCLDQTEPLSRTNVIMMDNRSVFKKKKKLLRGKKQWWSLMYQFIVPTRENVMPTRKYVSAPGLPVVSSCRFSLPSWCVCCEF